MHSCSPVSDSHSSPACKNVEWRPSNPRSIIDPHRIPFNMGKMIQQNHRAKPRTKIPLVGYISSIFNLILICTTHSDVEEAVRKPEVTPTHEVTAPNKAASTGKSHTLPDILLLLGISIMLIWPWMFFGIVWAKKGLQMNNHVAQLVKEHPHATTYFITLICSIISMIVTAFFSLAIIRFAQELVTYRTPTRPFHLSVLLAFRHQTWPWGKSLRDVKYLMNKDRWWLAALVVVCVVTFPQLVSSTTSLLTPGPFNRTAILTGTELNFSSTEPDCLAWFKAKPRSNDCDWQVSQTYPQYSEMPC